MNKLKMTMGVVAVGLMPLGFAEAFAVEVKLPADPKPYEQTAARELAHYLDLMGVTGPRFEIRRDDSKLKDEEWAVRREGDCFVFSGGGSRGALYAVYHFLEDVCGVRWWSDDDEDVPVSCQLPAQPFALKGCPYFRFRMLYRGDSAGKPNPLTAARCRFNNNGDEKIPLEFGGSDDFGSPYHTHVWDRYFPFEKYGKDHPEWYALRNGKRIGGQTVAQMCLTCPGLVEEFVKAVEGSIRKDRAACDKSGRPYPLRYSLNMNDNFGYCQCDTCREEYERLGFSGQVIRFTNDIARHFKEKYPEISFRMSAYNYTLDPPKVPMRAESNVEISIANMNQNMAQPMSHPDNAPFRQQLTDWGKFGDGFLVWDYTVTYIVPTYGFPFPSEYAIPENFRFYADHKVVDMTVEHERPQESDMYDLKFYLDRKLLEDPHADGAALLADFYRRYFGVAASKVREARDHLRKIYDERKAFVTWFPPTGEFNWIHADDIARLSRLFDEAEAAANGDAKLIRRIRKGRIGLDRLAAYRKSCGTPHAPEEGVSSVPFVDFRTDPNLWSLYRLSELKFVDDSRAANGKSVRLPAKTQKGFTWPIVFGLACNKESAFSRQIRVTEPKGSGWNWYVLPKVKFPETVCYVYFTWNLQLPATSPEIAGKTFDVKAHARFEDDACYVDRIAFVPCE